MALIQAEVDLSNQSLGRIGGKQFTLADQSGFPAEQANLHFDQTRDSLLRSYEWSFATTRIQLLQGWDSDIDFTTDMYVFEDDVLYKCNTPHTSSSDFSTDIANWTDRSDDQTSFGNYIDLPADWLRVKEYVDDDNTDWSIEGKQILTPDTEVELVYVKKEDDTTEWESTFTDAFIVKLALNLLNPLSGSGPDALNLRQILLREFRLLVGEAKTTDRQEDNSTGNSYWHKSRFGGQWRTDIGRNK